MVKVHTAIFRVQRLADLSHEMTTKYGVFSEPDYLGPGGIHSKIAAASAGGDGSGDEGAAAAYPPFKFRAQKKGKVH